LCKQKNNSRDRWEEDKWKSIHRQQKERRMKKRRRRRRKKR
jgi:hypothetical protein